MQKRDALEDWPGIGGQDGLAQWGRVKGTYVEVNPGKLQLN